MNEQPAIYWGNTGITPSWRMMTTTGTSNSHFTTTIVHDLKREDPPDIAVPAPVPAPRPTLPGSMALTLP